MSSTSSIRDEDDEREMMMMENRRNAVLLTKQSWILQRKIHGFDHPDILSTMTILGHFLNEQGNKQDADKIMKRMIDTRRIIVEVRKQFWGMDHPITLKSMDNLASVLSSPNDLEEVERIYRQTLEIRQITLGFHHDDTLINMYNLCDVLRTQRKWRETVSMCQHMIDILKIMNETDHRISSLDYHHDTVVNNSTLFLTRQFTYRDRFRFGDRDESLLLRLAEDYLQPSSTDDCDENRLSQSCEFYMNAMDLLIAPYRPTELPTMIESFSGGEALEISKRMKKYAIDHPNDILMDVQIDETIDANQQLVETLERMRTLARSCSQLHMYEESTFLSYEILDLRTKILGIEHLDTIMTIEELGDHATSFREWTDAKDFYTKALNLRKRVMGDDHPDTKATMKKLVIVEIKCRGW